MTPLAPSPAAIRFALALTSFIAVCQMPGVSFAKDLPRAPFVYKAESRKLADVLQDFAAALELPIVVADGVDGTVNGKFNLVPSSFLDLMGSAYGLTWYFDGTALYVYPARLTKTKIIFLRDFGADRVERLLKSLNLGDRRFPLRFDPAEKTLLVAGPPRHLEVVESMVDAIALRGRDDQKRTVKVFALRYATASDQKIGGVTVTGMTTMLNQVYGTAARTDGRNPAANVSSVPTALNPMEALYGSTPEGAAMQSRVNERSDKTMAAAASAFSLGSPAPTGPPAPNPTATATATVQSGEDEKPVFTADDANNAVIVTGLPTHMSTYADLIKQLDVSVDLIELEATIIDIRHDDALAIGVNWQARNHALQASSELPGTLANAAASAFQLTTLSADLSRQVLLTINALQQQGRARVVARPRVVGVANRLATMKDTRSASVRVAGNLSSNLYSIETGTHIEVVPRKVLVDGVEAIKLTLAIQDGSFDANTVDQIPIVKRTEISTEAYMGEGEGLLIGGISAESETSTRSGLPGLSQLPLIGALFRSDEDQASRRERLFLITPRLVPMARKDTVVSGLPALTKIAPPVPVSDTAPRLERSDVTATDHAHISRKK